MAWKGASPGDTPSIAACGSDWGLRAEEYPDLITEADDARFELLASGKRAFAFLEERDATVHVADSVSRSILAYLLTSAAFEVEYDWRERAVFVLACRGDEAARRGGYYTFEGRRARVHLLQALEYARLSDGTLRKKLRAIQRRSGLEAMPSQVEVFATVLEERLDALLDRYDSVFPQ